jgi:hypothetical protein
MKIEGSGDVHPRLPNESPLPGLELGPHCRFCGNLLYFVLRRWRTREGRARCSDGRLHETAPLGNV